MPDHNVSESDKLFNNPVNIAKRSNQKVHLVSGEHKAAMLAYIMQNNAGGKRVVITRTKRDADALSEYLAANGIKAAAIHANKSRGECEASANAFVAGELNTLVTTDMNLQAMGLKNLDRVISHDLPAEPEHYLYRMGCLADSGLAVALVSPEENSLLYAIERTMKRAIPQETVAGFEPEEKAQEAQPAKKQKSKPRHRTQQRKTAPKAGKPGKPAKPAPKKTSPAKRPVRRITLEDQKKKPSS